MKNIIPFIRYSDFLKMSLYILLMYWVYSSVGFLVMILTVIICINDFVLLIMLRIQKAKDVVNILVIGNLIQKLINKGVIECDYTEILNKES